MAGKTLKLESRSIPYLYLVLAVPLIVAALGQFNILPMLSNYVAPLLTIFAGLFVMSEIGAMGILRGKKLSKDPLRLFGTIIAILAIVTATLSLFGMSIALLASFQGVINLLLVFYIVIEAFR